MMWLLVLLFAKGPQPVAAFVDKALCEAVQQGAKFEDPETHKRIQSICVETVKQ